VTLKNHQKLSEILFQNPGMQQKLKNQITAMKPNKFILVQPIESTVNNITNIKTVNNYTVQDNSQKPH
jgi:hypothetical protein